MTQATKACTICKRDLTLDRFSPNGTYKGEPRLHTQCRDCLNEKKRDAYRTLPPSPPQAMSPEELFRKINRRVEADGVGGYCWRYEGPNYSSGGHSNVIQRLSQIIDGHPVPNPIQRWCGNTWCCNLDHLIPQADIRHVPESELWTSGETVEPSGFDVTVRTDDPRTVAQILRDMETKLDEHIAFVHDRTERALKTEADRFLREHGYNQWGRPLKYQVRKG